MNNEEPIKFPIEAPEFERLQSETMREGIKRGTAKERERMKKYFLAEYQRWQEPVELDDKEIEEYVDLIAIGAIGATSNLLVALVMGNEVGD